MGVLRFISDNGFKILIVLKICVIGYVISQMTGWVSWGEKRILAADEHPVAEKASVNPEVKGPVEASVKVAKNEGKSSGIEEDDETTRKSFLDDLLYLPKINTDALKKEEVGRYLGLVEKKKAQVEDRIKILSQRENDLKSLESSIDGKIKKLEEEMAFFAQTVQKEKVIKDERLENLVAFYQKMEPKKAAPVFEKLDKDLVVALFNKIPRKQTINILQLMKPDKSVELSEYYGRIRSGSEYDTLKEINSTLRKEFDVCKGMPTQPEQKTAAAH